MELMAHCSGCCASGRNCKAAVTHIGAHELLAVIRQTGVIKGIDQPSSAQGLPEDMWEAACFRGPHEQLGISSKPVKLVILHARLHHVSEALTHVSMPRV